MKIFQLGLIVALVVVVISAVPVHDHDEKHHDLHPEEFLLKIIEKKVHKLLKVHLDS